MDLPPRDLTVALALIQILKPLLTLTLYTTFLPLFVQTIRNSQPEIYATNDTHTPV